MIATNQNTQCVSATCASSTHILGKPQECYQCKECEKGSKPSDDRRQCLRPRIIETYCTCRERFSTNGFGCELCPEGTRPSRNNKRCVAMECDSDQIYRSDLTCPTCEFCPAGSIPDPTKLQCIVQPRPAVTVQGPRCNSRQIFNDDKTECVPCPVGTTSSNDRLRCLSDCNGVLDIVQSDGSCFKCCDGNVPNVSRTRCVKATSRASG